MRELIDLHNDIDTQFPSTILGVSYKDGAVWVNQWYSDVEDERKTAVQDFISNYDWSGESESEIKSRQDAEFKTALIEVVKERKR